jgi:hypothetical protein
MKVQCTANMTASRGVLQMMRAARMTARTAGGVAIGGARYGFRERPPVPPRGESDESAS